MFALFSREKSPSSFKFREYLSAHDGHANVTFVGAQMSQIGWTGPFYKVDISIRLILDRDTNRIYVCSDDGDHVYITCHPDPTKRILKMSHGVKCVIRVETGELFAIEYVNTPFSSEITYFVDCGDLTPIVRRGTVVGVSVER